MKDPILKYCGRCSFYVTTYNQEDVANGKATNRGKCHLEPSTITTIDETSQTLINSVVFPYVGFYQLGCSRYTDEHIQVIYDIKLKQFRTLY